MMSIVTAARGALAAACGAALLLSACGSKNSSSPTSPSVVPASATVTESFTTTLPVGGSIFYSFSIAQYGNVAVTLTDVAGAGVPDGVTLNLGIGRPGGTSCTVTTPTAISPGPSAQVTEDDGPGVFCVRIDDAGMLVAPARITATVAHA